MFNEKDLQQFSDLGIPGERIEWQLRVFIEGMPYIKLDRPATRDDGIMHLSRQEEDKLCRTYEQSGNLTKIKFVPASGAASRMFKSLFEYLTDPPNEPAREIREFIDKLSKFAFHADLSAILAGEGYSLNEILQARDYARIISLVLEPGGLNYGNLPKGLLKFHQYGDTSKTAFEEHLTEAGLYAVTGGKRANLHFTVSPEHTEAFSNLFNAVKQTYEHRFGVPFSVDFSVQKPSTDTMAVGPDNEPFRNPDGTILFRPGGHGALIYNLNELKADIIFIKNIDNVVPEKYIESTVRYKKILAGKLIEIQSDVFSCLEELESGNPGPERLAQMIRFVKEGLSYQPSHEPDPNDREVSKAFLRSVLNRPIRICGVVKNEGEPGGGPFWAPNSKGDLSLQIIESSQIDGNDTRQKAIFSEATHFNPVDLVCATLDYKGNSFDLTRFTDPSTCFISNKYKDGKPLKALELPGLWNGAMSDWITLFIEVPVTTFNPVKTVNDLLRPNHQP